MYVSSSLLFSLYVIVSFNLLTWWVFFILPGGLWSILSPNGYPGASLASNCFEEEREMCNSTSIVDVAWWVLLVEQLIVLKKPINNGFFIDPYAFLNPIYVAFSLYWSFVQCWIRMLIYGDLEILFVLIMTNLLEILNRELDSDFGFRARVARGIPGPAFPLRGNLETSFWPVSVQRWWIFCYGLKYIIDVSLILLMIVPVMTFLTYIWWVFLFFFSFVPCIFSVSYFFLNIRF